MATEAAIMEVIKTPTMKIRLNLMNKTVRLKKTVMSTVITVKPTIKMSRKLLMTIITMRLTKNSRWRRLLTAMMRMRTT